MSIHSGRGKGSILSSSCIPQSCAAPVDDLNCHTCPPPPSCDPRHGDSNWNSNSNSNANYDSNCNSNYNSNVNHTSVCVSVNVDVAACVTPADQSHQYDHQYDHQFDHGLDLSNLNFNPSAPSVLAPDVVDQSHATTAFNLDQINNLADNDSAYNNNVTNSGCVNIDGGSAVGVGLAAASDGVDHKGGPDMLSRDWSPDGGSSAGAAHIDMGANGTISADASISAFNQSIVLGANVQYNTSNMIGNNDSHTSYDHTGDIGHLPG